MDAYGLALDQARKELAEAQKKKRALDLRVSQLESVVSQLEALTVTEAADGGPALFENLGRIGTAPPAPTLTAPAPAAAQPPLWKAIINALNGKKSDFTVPEAIAALERTGRSIESKNRNTIVRNTLIQNKAFGRLGSGHYYVRGYEIDVKEEETEEAAKAAS